MLEIVLILAAGLAGWQSVYAGEAHQWPGFNVSEGYWGAHFMDSMLYAMGNDQVAMVIVATFWFLYTTLPTIDLVLLMRVCFPRGQRPVRAELSREAP
jgi:hypothetical protein